MELKKRRKLIALAKNGLPKYNNGTPGNGIIEGTSGTIGPGTGQQGPPQQGSVGGGAGKNLLNNSGAILSGAADMVGAVSNSFGPVKSAGDLLGDAGTSEDTVNGISYERLNGPNEAAEMANLKKENSANTLNAAKTGAALGGTIGSAFGPIGGAIGGVLGGAAGLVTGLFGGASRKRKLLRRIRDAKLSAERTNRFNVAGADSKYLQQQYALENGNTQDDLLYTARRGKDINKYGNKTKIKIPRRK